MAHMAFALLLGMSSVMTAAQVEQPTRIDIEMSNFKYGPSTIALVHNRPYVLHFTNSANGGHNFVARDFFSAAQIDAADRNSVKDGKVELRGGQSVDIRLTMPGPGRYEAHCSHLLHSSFGMKATIVVT